MYNPDYIGYKNTIGSSGDLISSGIATGTSAARVIATGGLDISADIALVLSSLAFGSGLWEQWTSHPAADARDFIDKLKPQLYSADPYHRLLLVIAGDTKINEKAKDVSSRELVLWYKQNFPNDYKTLTPEVKNYWNNYLVGRAAKYPDNPNGMRDNYINSKFTVSEVNSNATPLQAVSNLFTTSSSTGTSTTNWVLYGALAIGAILLIKYIKK